MIDQAELKDRIFEAFYLCNEMPRAMAEDYAERAARIAVNMANGLPRADYFNPKPLKRLA
jgi:hypothetical protein